MLHRTLAILLLAAAPIVQPSPALALSCAWGPIASLPPDGATGVPTNAVLRVIYLSSGPDETPVTLLGPGGQSVDVTLELASGEGGGERTYALTPFTPLEPSTTYRIAVGEHPEAPDPWILATFTTGAGPATQAPEPPVIIDTDRDAGSGEWGPWRYHSLVVEPAGAPVFYEVDVASTADFSSFRTVQVAPRSDGEHDVVAVGVGLCGGSLPLERRDRWLRARTVDMAGQISETSAAARAGGCSAVAGPASGLGALLLAGALGLRRRRRAVA